MKFVALRTEQAECSETSWGLGARVAWDVCVHAALNLASNQLKDAGAVALAAALPSNRSLTHLDLSSNQIEEKGLVAVADGIRYNAGVQALRLWGNTFAPLSSEAWHALLISTTTRS